MTISDAPPRLHAALSLFKTNFLSWTLGTNKSFPFWFSTVKALEILSSFLLMNKGLFKLFVTAFAHSSQDPPIQCWRNYQIITMVLL